MIIKSVFFINLRKGNILLIIDTAEKPIEINIFKDGFICGRMKLKITLNNEYAFTYPDVENVDLIRFINMILKNKIIDINFVDDTIEIKTDKNTVLFTPLFEKCFAVMSCHLTNGTVVAKYNYSKNEQNYYFNKILYIDQGYEVYNILRSDD